MKTFVFIASLLAAHLTASAQSPYVVDLVGSARGNIYVDKSWTDGAPAIDAKVSVSEDTAAAGMTLTAYFFSDDGKLVFTAKEPSDINNQSGGTVPHPQSYAKGKKYSFMFGIPQHIQSGNAKWRRVVVVFGKGTHFSAKVYPKDDLAKFDFPEKSLLKN